MLQLVHIVIDENYKPFTHEASTASSLKAQEYSHFWTTGFITALTTGLGITLGRGAKAGNCPTLGAAGRLNSARLNTGRFNAGLLNPGQANPLDNSSTPNAKQLIPTVVPITVPARIKPICLPY
jgi:hypothetical protein